MKKSLYATLFLLSACAVGPDYMRPDADIPAEFKEGIDWKQAAPQDEFKRNDWWKAFDDDTLNTFEAQVDISNQNIKVAEAQYRQAQALVQEARTAFFPVVTANGAETRGNAATTKPRTLYNASLNASWEPDLWGRIRRTVEANEAVAEATAADLESARLSAQASLAADYLQLRISDAQKRLLDRAVADYEKSLQLTMNQYNVGVAARSDVVQAQTQLETTKAQAIDIGVQRAQLEHAIAVLIGKPPAGFSVEPVDVVPNVPEIPIVVPSELLQRRPDIAGAERRAAAANAEIGVAEAAFFPDITLSAAGGYENSAFSHLFTLPNRVWSIGPSIAETIFDAGLRSAQTDATIAIYDQNVATYRQTVLGGFQEVEDNLAALRILAQEADAEHSAVKSAEQAAAIALNQYKAGTVSYLNVIIAQTTALTDERSELAIAGERLTAAVTLIKALGGSWDAPLASVMPETAAAKPDSTDELCEVDRLAQKQFYLLNSVATKR